MTNTTPIAHRGRLTDVGARHGGRLVIKTTVETARDIAPSLYTDVEVVAAGTVERLSHFADALAASCHTQTERAETAEGENEHWRTRINALGAEKATLLQFRDEIQHQLATLARHVLDDDLVAARDYLIEIGFGVEVDRG